MSVPFRSSYEPNRRWVLTEATGRIGLSEVRAHLFERKNRQLVGRELIDTTRAALFMAPSDLAQAAMLIREVSSLEPLLGPTAIWVISAFDYGMAALLARLLDDVLDIRPFRSRDEAERWLTLGPFRHATP